jgi:hypothetical protein
LTRFGRFQTGPAGLSRETAEAAVKKYQEGVPATARRVQGWATDVHGPPFSDDQAMEIASILHDALASPCWLDVWAANREQDPDMLRGRRVAEALRTLQKDLPLFIETWRGGKAPVSIEVTAALLDFVHQHRPLLDIAPLREKGRAPSMERTLAARVSRTALVLWGDAGTKTAADALAAKALGWVVGYAVPPSDATVSKARRRRT